MDKNFLIKLTTNLYRLTLLFPKKEPLRYKTRELADDILANCVLILGGSLHKSKNLVLEAEKDLEVLDGYFEVAKSQNWVSPFDILEIQKEYSKIKDEIARLAALESIQEKIKDPQSASLEPIVALDSRTKERGKREEKILEVLRERGRIQVGELKQISPQISKRTLRRDFRALIEQGLVERIGEKNDTFYQLKR